MNKEEQRIAIAEACGWKFEKKLRSKMLSPILCWHITDPDNRIHTHYWHNFRTANGPDSKPVFFEGDITDAFQYIAIPDYLNDLDAMHEAEEKCIVNNSEKRITYAHKLMKMSKWAALHTTPAQRAEAFLKTLDLWKETQ